MTGKLSEIRVSSPAAAITGTELVEVTQSGATKAATVAEILGAQSLDGLSDVTVTGAVQGAILYRAAAGWVHLPAGAAGEVLTTAGAGANPTWAAVAGGSGGTVTSVALSAPSFLSVAGSPITGTGTLALSLANQGAGLVFAAPAGATGAPSFRALVSTDLPGHSHAIADVAGLQSELDGKASAVVAVNNQAVAAYTLALGDAGGCVRMTGVSASAVTIPTAAAVAYPVGASVAVRQVGAGAVSLAGASGVTINIPAGYAATTARQGATMMVLKVAADEWDLTGDIAPV